MKSYTLFIISLILNACMCFCAYKSASVQTGVKCFQFTHERETALRKDVLDLHEGFTKIYMENYEDYCEVMKLIDEKFKAIFDYIQVRDNLNESK